MRGGGVRGGGGRATLYTGGQPGMDHAVLESSSALFTFIYLFFTMRAITLDDMTRTA